MESDSIGNDDKQKKEHRMDVHDDSDISEPSGLRRIGGWNNEGNWVGLLDYNAFTLCIGGIIFLCSLFIP